MNAPEDKSMATDERRRSDRRTLQSPLRVYIDTPQFGGQAENISAAGVYFFTSDSIHVRVEFEEDGQVKSYRGKLARAQRLSDHNNGYAIEFEPQ